MHVENHLQALAQVVENKDLLKERAELHVIDHL